MSQTWVEGLIADYDVTKKELEKYREGLMRGAIDSDSDWTELGGDKNEHQIVGGMISDMDHALEWMKRGRRPGNRRGIERQSVYQRTALLDPDLFPSLDIEPRQERTLADHEKRAMIDILWTLSQRERECYVLHMSYGMSYAEIAVELKVGRTSVQKYVERAKKKVLEKI